MGKTRKPSPHLTEDPLGPPDPPTLHGVLQVRREYVLNKQKTGFLDGERLTENRIPDPGEGDVVFVKIVNRFPASKSETPEDGPLRWAGAPITR